MLVSAGADINDRGGRECGGITPLHDAAQWGNVEITKYLVRSTALNISIVSLLPLLPKLYLIYPER